MKSIHVYDLSTRWHWIISKLCMKLNMEIGMFWLPLTTTQNGVKQDLLKIMMLLLPQDFWKRKSYANLVCPDSFSRIMEVSGWLNLT